jgi:hypothetical protein
MAKPEKQKPPTLKDWLVGVFMTIVPTAQVHGQISTDIRGNYENWQSYWSAGSGSPARLILTTMYLGPEFIALLHIEGLWIAGSSDGVTIIVGDEEGRTQYDSTATGVKREIVALLLRKLIQTFPPKPSVSDATDDLQGS